MSRSTSRYGRRLTAKRLLAGIGLGLLAMATAARFVDVAVLGSRGTVILTPYWINEQLSPLIGLLVDQRPITAIDQRQYGAVFFLVFDPVLRFARADLVAIEVYALVVAVAATAAALILTLRRYFGTGAPFDSLVVLLWFNFVPLLVIVALRVVDAWQLFFITASLFLFTSSGRWRALSGVPLAFAALTKLLPLVILGYLLIRDRRAGAIAVLTIVVLLAIAHLLYGPLMGFGYPLAILSTGPGAVAWWSTFHENDSLRGLLFKAAVGFRVGDGPHVVTSDLAPLINVVAYAIAGALFAYLLWVAWRGRGDDSLARRSIQFGLAVVTMLLISPHTSHEYTIVTLPVFAILLHLYRARKGTPWSAGQLASAIGAAILVGIFVPMAVMARVIPLDFLVEATSNQDVPFLGPAIGRYDLLGFPGLGLILAWIALVALERRSHSARTSVPLRIAAGGTGDGQ